MNAAGTGAGPGTGPDVSWLNLSAIPSTRTKTLALSAVWHFTQKGADSIISKLKKFGYKNAVFTYDSTFKWIDVTCRPEDEASIFEEFELLAGNIENSVFSGENQNNLFRDDGTLKDFYHEMMSPVNWVPPNELIESSYLSDELKRLRYVTCYQPPLNLRTIFSGNWLGSERMSKAFDEIQRQLSVKMQENLWLKHIYVASDNEDEMYEAVRRFEIFLQATDAEQEDEEDRDFDGLSGNTFHVVVTRGKTSLRTLRTRGFTGPDVFPLVFRITALCWAGLAKTTLFDPTRFWSLTGSYRWLYRHSCVVRQVVWEWTSDEFAFTDAALTTSVLGDRDPDRRTLWHDQENAARPFPSRMKDRFRPQCSYKQLQTGYISEGTTGDRVSEWLDQLNLASTEKIYVPVMNTKKRAEPLKIQPGSDCTSDFSGAALSDIASERSILNIRYVGANERTFAWDTLMPTNFGLDVRGDIDDATCRILRTMPYKRGIISMRAEVGRIISLATPGYRGMDLGGMTLGTKNLWKRSVLTNNLMKFRHHADVSHFTKILTTYAFELADIFRFKVASYQSEPNKPRQWDYALMEQGRAQLVYSFFFFRREDKKGFIIDVHDTGKHDQFTYSIHTHSFDRGKDGRKHVLDVRIVMTHVDEEELENKFGAFAREFFKSLKISFKQPKAGYVRDKDNPLDANVHLDVRFQIPGRFGVDVTAARVLTTWRCDSARSSSAFLEVTEVEQLDLKVNDVESTTKAAGNVDNSQPDRSVRVSAWSNELRVEKRDQGEFPYWYEVSVGSDKLEEAFEENKSLKLGEKASWDASEFTSDGNAAFYEMYAPALEMAKQLQHLGQYTDNNQSERYNPWHSRHPNEEDRAVDDDFDPSPTEDDDDEGDDSGDNDGDNDGDGNDGDGNTAT
ncbi:hypothetical protein QBC34DRAFT_458043 [Podospora aff. communis PSN243]|uniref:Uncharacterized protein n=1 Tax=Podospora aff. communis PSN243 TaxID=3040156 RepID=A0AAV9GUP8_9PEZI|nr:hypothetical protein QBC34DRAFT_458043 [Podospora aff. communis PSN243]